MKNPDILIVGAGPTGLTLANLLARSGVDFLIIDSKEKPSQDSKAFGIHARSLEVFHQLGTAEKAITEGNVDNTFHILSKNDEVASFRLNTILPEETPYPHFLILPQNQTERILVDALEKQGNSVQWNYRLIDLSYSNGIYSAVIADDNEEEYHIYPKYIVGCDGADSTVRKKAGISFKGKSFTSPFFLADVEMDTKLIHGDIYFAIATNHLSVIFSYKKKDHFRAFNFINSAIHKKKKDKLSHSEIQKILEDNSSLDAKVKSMQWGSIYNIHCRLAGQFAKDNILLAGDAAHVHSPMGGQGMNTGIQDAYNLGWKIRWTLEHQEDHILCQSYHAERYPIARNLHYSTDKLFQLLIKRNIFIDRFRVYFFPYVFRLLSNRVFLKILFRRVSQIAIKYRYSSLSKSYNSTSLSLSSPKAGDRTPWVKISYKGAIRDLYDMLDYRYFTLLLAAGTSDYGHIIMFLKELLILDLPMLKVYFFSHKDNHTFYKTYGINRSAMYLIRPDGHIGFKSGQVSIQILKKYYKELIINV